MRNTSFYKILRLKLNGNNPTCKSSTAGMLLWHTDIDTNKNIKQNDKQLV